MAAPSRWTARAAVAVAAMVGASALSWIVPPLGLPDGLPAGLPDGSAPPLHADPGRPFANSAAEGWRDGELGLVTPRPRARAGFTEQEMRLAYWHVRRILAAANVDPRAVFGGDASQLAALLGRAPGPNWTTSFVSGTIPAAPHPKVEGTVVEGTLRPGAVRVRARHLFVYALRPPENPGAVKRIVVRRSTTLLIHRTGPGVAVRVQGTSRTALGASCTAQGLRPSYGRLPKRPPAEPYDPTNPPSGPCRPNAAT